MGQDNAAMGEGLEKLKRWANRNYKMKLYE
jgi:hypothetical protein